MPEAIGLRCAGALAETPPRWRDRCARMASSKPGTELDRSRARIPAPSDRAAAGRAFAFDREWRRRQAAHLATGKEPGRVAVRRLNLPPATGVPWHTALSNKSPGE